MRMRIGLVVFMALILCAGPALAYHPINTEDPGTTEFRHFEMEWGNYIRWTRSDMDEITGYVALKSGLAPRLEFDALVDFVYWMEEDGRETSGWGDVEMTAKYRILGDGEGPFNLGALVGAAFPSAMERVGGGGDLITPWALIFGTVGAGKFRILADVGVNWAPEEPDTMLYGCALEFAAHEKILLAAEIAGDSDFERGGGNDPARVGAGVVFAANDWLALSLGGHWGISPDAEKFYLTFATIVGW